MKPSLIFIAGLALALPPLVGVAQETSARTVQYHSQDIVPIHAKLKYTTLIEVPPTEKIMEAATGDKDFWVVDVVGNFCFDRQIGSQFYERIALSRNKAAMLQKAETPEPDETITPEEAIKDPYVLEFLDLKDEYSESDLEEALIRHLADFLLELGDDFAFVARQRRIRIDDNWFRVDLVFFHRRLKSLLVVDLKIDKFSYADAGYGKPDVMKSAT